MNLKVIKAVGDTSKPDTVEADTSLKIGDSFEMEYDWCTKIPCINGYKPIWHKDIAEFTVVDIVCNMLINPSSVWVRLKSVDELFQKRCGAGCFDVPEDKVLERIREAEKKNRRKENSNMILNKKEQSIEIDGKLFKIGNYVIGTNAGDYDGIIGIIREIRTNSDKETDNNTADIYCDFLKPVMKNDIKTVEDRFSKIYKSDYKIDDIDFSGVILAPKMLDIIGGNGTKINIYLVKEDWAYNDSYDSTVDAFFDKESALIDFKKKLSICGSNGDIIPEMSHMDDFISEESGESYECYVEGFYDDNHYSISVDCVEAEISDRLIKSITPRK